MQRRSARASWLYLLAAVLVAALAGVVVHSYLEQVAAAGATGIRAQVVVAAADISRGTAIAPDQLTVVRMPKLYAPPRSLSQVSQAAGRVALGDLLKGEAVTDNRLARVRAGPVASLVPEGLRAFAVPTSLPPGTVRDGDHVDVLATFSSGQPHTEMVVTGVEVLLVVKGGGDALIGGGDNALDATGSSSSPSNTLILLVSPDQEESLAFARAFANLEVAIAPSSSMGTAATTKRPSITGAAA
jgi:Flp pilus assembly protein CpaB